MRHLITVFSILCLLLAGLAAAEEMAYDVLSTGKMVGSCTLDLSSRGGGYFLQTQYKTEGEGGVYYKEEVILDSDWIPQSYTLEAELPAGEIQLAGSFDEKGASFSGKMGMGSMSEGLESEEPLAIWMDDAPVSGLAMLLPRIDYSIQGALNQFPVVLPGEMKISEVELTVKGSSQGGYYVSVARSGGVELEANYNPENNTLLGYKTSGGMVLRPAQKEEKAEVSGDLPEGYHPLTTMMMEDEDFLGGLEEISEFSAALAVSFPEAAAGRLYLNHFSQEFAGQITATEATGQVEVKKMGHKVTNSPDWPLYYPLKGVEPEYTMPERGIDSDHEGIIARAKKTVEPARTMWDAARAINLWVNRNIEYKLVSAGASQTFESRVGDSRAKSMLCAAMCRAVGIPARIVSGVIYADGPTDHSWVEVYLGERVGWGPMDPTLNQADDIDAAHISLWLGTEWPPVFARNIVIEKDTQE